MSAAALAAPGGVDGDVAVVRGVRSAAAAADAAASQATHPRLSAAAVAPLALPLPWPNAALGLPADAATAGLACRWVSGPPVDAPRACAAATLARPPPAWRPLLTEWGLDEEGVAEAAAGAREGEALESCV